MLWENCTDQVLDPDPKQLVWRVQEKVHLLAMGASNIPEADSEVDTKREYIPLRLLDCLISWSDSFWDCQVWAVFEFRFLILCPILKLQAKQAWKVLCWNTGKDKSSFSDPNYLTLILTFAHSCLIIIFYNSRAFAFLGLDRLPPDQCPVHFHSTAVWLCAL